MEEKFVEKKQADGEDRGEIRTVHTFSAASGKGISQCEHHSFRKLSENEIVCVKCPTILIVNPEVLDSMIE